VTCAAGFAASRAVEPRAVDTLPASRGGQDVVGKAMPPLDFERWVNTEGGKPEQTKGRVVLYRWWTNECPHCEKSLPAIELLRKKYGFNALTVVAVYHPKPVREIDDGDVRRWARELGYAGAVAVDADWSELKKFYLSKEPRAATSASFLVDRKGVIRFAHPGPRFYPSDKAAEIEHDRDYRLIDKAIATLLEEG
jgi:thiol-disulfide isomerase/thioredoxin